MAIYYVTKYCLTQGIFEVNLQDDNGNSIASGTQTTDGYTYHVAYFINKECFLDKTTAIEDAYQRRDKAIAAAEKKIQKLKSLEFEV